MSIFPLKPTSSYIKAYFAALAKFQQHGHLTEGNTRSAFADLLSSAAFYQHVGLRSSDCYRASVQSFTGSGTEATLRAFAKSIRGIPSELGKREQFSSLLGTLFPHAPETAVLQRGSETSLNILNSNIRPVARRSRSRQAVKPGAFLPWQRKPR